MIIITLIKLTTSVSSDSLAARREKHCWIYETRLADLLLASLVVARDRVKFVSQPGLAVPNRPLGVYKVYASASGYLRSLLLI